MTKALIVGGGVAGPTAAIALQKAGIEPVVYEAYDRGADGIGQNLVLAVNGYSALLTLGISHLADGFDIPRYRFHLGNGKQLAQVPNGAPLPDGTVARAITRSDLYATLRDEAINRGVEVNFGKRLVDAKITDEGVTAVFADGTTARGDLLIGADGLHSVTRKIIEPAELTFRYGGLWTTGGYATGISAPSDPGTEFMYLGKRAFFCHIPDQEGRIWWYASVTRPKEPTAEELASFTPDVWRETLYELFAKDQNSAVDIIKATEDIWPPRPIQDIPHLPTWHNERMIVIGDACHATSPSAGQGVSMAIEDAVELARCLRDIPDVGDAFRRYEEIRRERVERVVDFGRQCGRALQVNGRLFRIGRDIFARVAYSERGSKEGQKEMRWLYEHRIDWDSPVGRAGAGVGA
ncbi:FAD-dependent oxidoreductase [Streptomyces millisiae]|uniref:NAD(P)/FAD-dependent oxidoreductase n=1 Tax=Streptomyces millisiae TaxID=3075542 RepID=A0ABU2LRF5_9ACTN|nr:NAD(P)/FAD-dependent oxidoreductase [Streptomyces sp. DSM 44918]MDT0319797.1 NAD(P)/FAD-dependent oxidoreductase [Streptomyces sp. DSM 44918]